MSQWRDVTGNCSILFLSQFQFTHKKKKKHHEVSCSGQKIIVLAWNIAAKTNAGEMLWPLSSSKDAVHTMDGSQCLPPETF